jgi:hypothetical protein
MYRLRMRLATDKQEGNQENGEVCALAGSDVTTPRTEPAIAKIRYTLYGRRVL